MASAQGASGGGVLLLWLLFWSIEVSGLTFRTEPDLLFSGDPLVAAAQALNLLETYNFQAPLDLTHR
jgi:hypothetical protein